MIEVYIIHFDIIIRWGIGELILIEPIKGKLVIKTNYARYLRVFTLRIVMVRVVVLQIVGIPLNIPHSTITLHVVVSKFYGINLPQKKNLNDIGHQLFQIFCLLSPSNF